MDPKVHQMLDEANRAEAKIRAAPVITQSLVSRLNELVAELNDNTVRLGGQTAQVEMAVRDLDATLTAFHASSERSANVMVWLTAAIAVLTLAIVALTVATLL
jgi:hypothetical protein